MLGSKTLRTVGSFLAVGALLATVVAPAGAHARGGMGGPGGGGLMPLLRAVNLTPEQQTQVRSILSASRQANQQTAQQLRQAQKDLSDRLLTPGQLAPADLQSQMQQIGQLRQQLLQSRAQTALEIRAILTPEQLAKAAEVKTRMQQLRSEMRQLMHPGQP